MPASLDADGERGYSLPADEMYARLKEMEDHLALHPLDTNVLLKHADLCRRAGLIEKAAESLDKILLVLPENEEALALKTKLDL